MVHCHLRLHLSAKNASYVQNKENKEWLLEKAVKTLTVYSSNLSPLKQLCDHMENQQKYFYDITKHQLWLETQTTFDQEVIQKPGTWDVQGFQMILKARSDHVQKIKN